MSEESSARIVRMLGDRTQKVCRRCTWWTSDIRGWASTPTSCSWRPDKHRSDSALVIEPGSEFGCVHFEEGEPWVVTHDTSSATSPATAKEEEL